MKIKNTRKTLTKAVTAVFLVSIFISGFITFLSSGKVSAETGSGYFSPSSGTYTVGQQFNVDVHIDVTQSYEEVYVYFTVGSQLQYESYTIDSGNTGEGTGSIVAQGNNEYELEYSSGYLTNGDSSLATLTFKATSAGTATLTMDSATTKTYSYTNTAQGTENGSYTINHPAAPPASPTAPASLPPTTSGSSPQTTISSSSQKTTFSKSSSNSTSSVSAPTTPSVPSGSSTSGTTTTNPITTLLNTSPKATNKTSTSKSSVKTKHAKSNTGFAIFLTLMLLSVVGIFIVSIIRRRRSNELGNYFLESDSLTLPTASSDLPPYSLNEAIENDSINRSIDKAFYPMRYKAEEAKKNHDQKR